MNLFVAHWNPNGGTRAERLTEELGRLASAVPFMPGDQASWAAPSGRLAVASLTHSKAQTAQVRYAHFEETRMAMFAGRPYLWVGDLAADGENALDPAFYLRPIESWLETLDGRCCVLRYDDSEGALEIVMNPFGAYQLFAAQAGADWWVSSNAELVRRFVGSTGSRPSTLASFFAAGWSVGGEPRWNGVERLSPIRVHRFAPGLPNGREERANDPHRAESYERPFDVEGAARTFVASMRALSAWPGRRNIVPVSGGRDSRVVLAAALAAGFPFEARTMTFPHLADYPETADVRIAKQLCRIAGCSHHVIEQEQRVEPAEAARLLRLVSPGSVSLELASQSLFARPYPDTDEPLELVHTGQGGELARAWYGDPAGLDFKAVTDRLYRRTTNLWPRPIVSREGAELYRSILGDWVERVAAREVPKERFLDLFYLEARMSCWTASQSVIDYSYELTNPYCSRRLVPWELAVPAGDRARDLFHLRVLEQLSAPLLDVPFDARPPWRSDDARRQTSSKLVRLALKGQRELARRGRNLRGWRPPGASRDPFPKVMRETRQRVLDWPSHEAWDVLNRRRVTRLLGHDPFSLDSRSRSFVWRLATVFVGDEA